MANEIKAKLVLDTSGMAGVGAAAGGGGTGFNMGTEFRRALEGLDMPVLGDIGAALAGMTVFLSAILKGITGFFKFVAGSSPIFATSINLLKKSLQVLLRPIGDIMGLFLKPLAIAMLRFAIPIYKKWREFLKLDSTQEGLKDVNEGAGKVGAGIISLDFGMVKEGLMEMAGGIKEVASGFLSFMGTETVGLGERLMTFFTEAWTFFKDTFQSVSDWIGNKIDIGLTWAWEKFWKFVGNMGDDEWKEKVSGFQSALEAAWGVFGKVLEKFDWWDPLGNFFVTFGLMWDTIVGPMMIKLREALENEFPVLMGFINNISEKLASAGEGEEGFLAGFIANAFELDNQIAKLFGPASIFYTLGETALEVMGKNKDDTTEGTVIGSMNATAAAIVAAGKELTSVKLEIDSIKTYVKTIWEIEVSYTGGGKPTF